MMKRFSLFLTLSLFVLVEKVVAENADDVLESFEDESYSPVVVSQHGQLIHAEEEERPKRFDAFMNGFGTSKRNFDEINRSSFGFNKRNFDEINRSAFGFNKRNFDEINRSAFGFDNSGDMNKRNFDEINRSSFGFNKRNFDEINRSSFGFNKRNFDEINRSSFGFYNPSSDYQLKAIRRSQKPQSKYDYSFYPFFKRSGEPQKKNFDEINRSHFGFSG